MNRGMVKLLPNECTLLISIVGATPEKLPELENFLAKISATSNVPANQEIAFEVNEEEMELVLDALPPPGPQANQQLTMLRTKITDFLQTLRQ